MKPAAAALAILVLGTLPGAASFKATDWQSVSLPTAGGTNQWFFFPDGSKNPRVVVKAIANTGSVNRVGLNGGPPAWTADPAVSTAGMNKEGVFVQSGSDGGFLIGPHFVAPNYRLRMWTFNGVAVGNEVIDNVANTSGMTGVSAMLDPAGNLHAAWIWNPGANESLVYGRRNASGVWEIDEQIFSRPAGGGADNGIRIGDTAVVPSAFGTANIYFTLNTPVTQPTSGIVTSLVKMNSVVNGGTLLITDPTVLVTAGVKNVLRGTRVGSVDRVYYFEGLVNPALKRWSGSGSSDVQGAVANGSPRGIHLATSPVDGRQRIAWYDGAGKKVYYLRPNALDNAYTVFNPITLTGGALADADLQGLHFDAAGLPHILYKRAVAEGYVAFPNDAFDFNGNQRIDLFDDAFDFKRASPIGAVSAGKFKIEFPTVGNAVSNGTGAVVTSAGSNESLKYEVEVSTNGTTWTKITSGAQISYSSVVTGGTGDNQKRTFTGTFPETFTGHSKRLARLIVTRTPYPY